jgi:mannose-1-phosphate guanylyltransferase
MPDMPDAIVLCGGAGLRLRSVTGNAPKAMATIAGRPFLDLLFRQLRRHGFRHVILAVGYQQDVISSSYGERACGLSLSYAAESSPLGTGGALRNAAEQIESDNVLIMNGDSYTDADLSQFVENHRRAQADLSIVVVPADGRGDCGSVQTDQDGKVVRFMEKQSQIRAPYYVNAGIYVISRRMIKEIQLGLQISLENVFFPRWLEAGKAIRAFVHAGPCVDIGTPERYQIAQQMLADAEKYPVTSA